MNSQRPAQAFSVSAWGTQLAGLHWPGKKPSVLALHGWLDNAASFQPLAQLLEFDLYALDFSGHGLSGHRPVDAATHYVDHVRDVLVVADELGMEKIHLLGHSMGAGVAALFAATFPERIASLTLIEGIGPPSTEAGLAPQTLRQAVDDMRALPEKKMPVYPRLEDAVAARTKGFGGLSEAACQLLCERGLKEVEGGWSWRSDPRLRLTSSLRMTEDQVDGFLKAIRAPTLLIEAEQGMGLMTDWQRREQQVADLKKVRLPGRHHLHMEHPEPLASVIGDFITQHSEQVVDGRE